MSTDSECAELLHLVEVRYAALCMVLALIAGIFPIASALQGTESPGYSWLLDQIDAERAWSAVDDLARGSYEGRRAGTSGADLASEYIARHFASIGLKPGGEDGTYRTRFTMPLWRLTEMPTLAMPDAKGGILQAFTYRKDFKVIPGSGQGDYSAEVVFAGYGITAGAIGYDDYETISARGKIVLAIVGTPSSGRFGERDYGATYVKADNALSHGAVGLILADNSTESATHYVERSSCGCCWAVYEKLTILGTSVDLANLLLKDSNSTLSVLQRTIDQDLSPKSFDLEKRLTVSVRVSFSRNAPAYNVLGFVPGSDPAASGEPIIIGAHYDHWGKDVDGAIFPGANDDASGVAVVMEIARVFSSAAKPRHPVLFAAWSGEEEGWFGSHAYVSHPYFPVDTTVAYLNLDMVGYGQTLSAQASERHETLRATIRDSAQVLDISLDLVGYHGGSDHVPFEEKDVPNVMFIYWPDDVYHTPEDMASHVSRRNLIETARLTALVALRLSEATVEIPNERPSEPIASVLSVQSLAIVFVALVVIAGFGAVCFYNRQRHRHPSNARFT